MESLRTVAEELGLTERMNENQILASGFKAVDLEGIAPFEDELQIFDREAHQIIRAKWEAKLAKNPTVFPGPLASIQSFEVVDGILKFRLQRSRFDIYDGLRDRLPAKLDLGQKRMLDQDFCLPLSVGAVAVTAPTKKNPTGTIIFGIRSQNAAFGEGNSTTLPAGYFNPDSDRLVMGDPALHRWLMSARFTIIKELQEEVGIHDYKTLEYLGLIYDGVLAKQPLLAVRLFLSFTAEEMKTLVCDAGFEVDRYYFVPNTREAVRGFVGRYPPTPHSVGGLILHFAEK